MRQLQVAQPLLLVQSPVVGRRIGRELPSSSLRARGRKHSQLRGKARRHGDLEEMACPSREKARQHMVWRQLEIRARRVRDAGFGGSRELGL